MCMGGGNNSAPTPPAPTPGIVDVSKAQPDPSQAFRYKGDPVGTNMTGRVGGPLTIQASTQPKATFGGT